MCTNAAQARRNINGLTQTDVVFLTEADPDTLKRRGARRGSSEKEGC